MRPQEYLRSTFKYTGLGLAITAGAATLAFKNGLTYRMMALNPWLVMGGSLVLSIGSMYGVYATAPDSPAHYLSWGVFSAAQGLTLSPMFFIAPAILGRAGLYTAGAVGGISYVGATAKSDEYMWMGGPLLAGLGVLIASSLDLSLCVWRVPLGELLKLTRPLLPSLPSLLASPPRLPPPPPLSRSSLSSPTPSLNAALPRSRPRRTDQGPRQPRAPRRHPQRPDPRVGRHDPLGHQPVHLDRPVRPPLSAPAPLSLHRHPELTPARRLLSPAASCSSSRATAAAEARKRREEEGAACSLLISPRRDC